MYLPDLCGKNDYVCETNLMYPVCCLCVFNNKITVYTFYPEVVLLNFSEMYSSFEERKIKVRFDESPLEVSTNYAGFGYCHFHKWKVIKNYPEYKNS